LGLKITQKRQTLVKDIAIFCLPKAIFRDGASFGAIRMTQTGRHLKKNYEVKPLEKSSGNGLPSGMLSFDPPTDYLGCRSNPDQCTRDITSVYPDRVQPLCCLASTLRILTYCTFPLLAMNNLGTPGLRLLSIGMLCVAFTIESSYS
jgi:hypothetical protein